MSNTGVTLILFIAAALGLGVVAYGLWRLTGWLYFRSDAAIDEHAQFYDRRWG